MSALSNNDLLDTSKSIKDNSTMTTVDIIKRGLSNSTSNREADTNFTQ